MHRMPRTEFRVSIPSASIPSNGHTLPASALSGVLHIALNGTPKAYAKSGHTTLRYASSGLISTIQRTYHQIVTSTATTLTIDGKFVITTPKNNL